MFEEVLKDASFYNKPVLLAFSSVSCGNTCERLLEDIEKSQVGRKFIPIRLDADEHLGYFLRYSRGTVPTFTVVDHKGSIYGIISSSDSKFVVQKLSEIYNSLDRIKPIGLTDWIPNREEFSPVDVLKAIDNIVIDRKVDIRGLQLMRIASLWDHSFQTIMEKLTPMDSITSRLIGDNASSIECPKLTHLLAYASKVSDQCIYKLRDLIDEKGAVKRSEGSAFSGYLIDQATTADALISVYSRQGDEDFLSLAKKVVEYSINNLKVKTGFRDYLSSDQLTSNILVEPLSNSEMAISLARLYLITEEERYKELAKESIEASIGAMRTKEVLIRDSIAWIKLNSGIKTEKPADDLMDPRVERVKALEKCKGYLRGEECKEKPEEFNIEI